MIIIYNSNWWNGAVLQTMILIAIIENLDGLDSSLNDHENEVGQEMGDVLR